LSKSILSEAHFGAEDKAFMIEVFIRGITLSSIEPKNPFIISTTLVISAACNFGKESLEILSPEVIFVMSKELAIYCESGKLAIVGRGNAAIRFQVL
jgi:hypothetical protein